MRTRRFDYASVAIVGDRDPDMPLHRKTKDAIAHAAVSLRAEIETDWIRTADLASGARGRLDGHDAVFIASGSPYENPIGVLDAIRHARGAALPLLGTCAGYQHIAIEFARSILAERDATSAEYEGWEGTPVVTRLETALVDTRGRISLVEGSRAHGWYAVGETEEVYDSHFGVRREAMRRLEEAGLIVSGRDSVTGDARVVELRSHPFFVGTAFVPEASSTPDAPHPLIVWFVRHALHQRRFLARAS